MNLKNARIYKLSAPITADTEQLNTALAEFKHQPMLGSEAVKYGFTTPLHPAVKTLAYSLSNGVTVIAFKRSEKILPAAVINEELQPKIDALEQEKGRPLSRKEKQSLKEELIQTLLPRALIRSKTTHAYIDSVNQWIVVDTPSSGTAEDVLALLRKAIGTLPALPWLDNHKLNSQLQLWLQNQALPVELTLGHNAQLKAPDEEGAKAQFANHLLSAEEVQSHLQDKLVTKLQLSKQDVCDFTVTDDGALTAIKWADAITAKNDEMGWDDLQARLEADLYLLTTELRRVLAAIHFGVENSDEQPATAKPVAKNPIFNAEDEDYLYTEAVAFVIAEQRVSVTGVQRKFRIGYNRAAYIVEAMERNGVVSTAKYDGCRKVLVSEVAE